MDEELNETLWATIKGRAGTGDIIVAVCYKALDQKEQAHEALYRQIEAASYSQVLVLVGNFKHP